MSAQSPMIRTAYLTAVDGKGALVTDLLAADLTVKEGGKVREIVSISPSTSRLHVAIAVGEGLTGDTSVRSATVC